MKIYTLNIFIIYLFGLFNLTSEFIREDYYNALSSSSLDLVNKQLGSLNSLSFEDKQAFIGAMIMKKSGLIHESPLEKLKQFKEGRIKLETAIIKDSNNIEFRFLRLVIQENCPKILSYNKELSKDSFFIRKKINNINIVLKKIIVNYSKTSKYLVIPN